MKQLKTSHSAFMRSDELLLVKFQDKKASGEKEIFLIDSKGTAGISLVERYEKGKRIIHSNHSIQIRFRRQQKTSFET